MSYLVRAFLESELTGIPSMMDNLMGKHYNNALYNGTTWLVLILHVFHFIFDITLNGLLKKMRFKEYVRLRLRKSLWYLGFYSCSFLYCGATLWKNGIRIPHRYKFAMLDLDEPVSTHFILGYALLSSFYASSSLWEGLHCSFLFFTYLFLFGFVAFTYFLRYIELAILLACTFSLVHVISEMARCSFCVFKEDSRYSRIVFQFTFYSSIFASGFVYFVVIPMSFVLPLVRGFCKNPNSVIMAGLNVSIWGWLICEIYASPVYRLVQHRWYHGDKELAPTCLDSTMECALFFPRTDAAYKYSVMKQEVKERQEKMMALRKPKTSANALMQTLKCVAAINRKIKYRKLLANFAQTASDTDVLSDTKEESRKETNLSDIDCLLDNENSSKSNLTNNDANVEILNIYVDSSNSTPSEDVTKEFTKDIAPALSVISDDLPNYESSSSSLFNEK